MIRVDGALSLVMFIVDGQILVRLFITENL